MWFGKGAETEGSGGRGRDNRGEEDWRSKRGFFFFFFLKKIFIREIVFEIMRCGLIGFFFTFTRIDELALHWSHRMLSTVEICAIAHRAIP